MFDGILTEAGDPLRPTLAIADPTAMKAVFKRERPVLTRHRPTHAAPAAGSSMDTAPLEPADAALFEKLRAWRKQIAVDQGVPPYVVFPDRTLKAIASAKPESLPDLRAIPGVGDTKLVRYGDGVLDVVRAG